MAVDDLVWGIPLIVPQWVKGIYRTVSQAWSSSAVQKKLGKALKYMVKMKKTA